MKREGEDTPEQDIPSKRARGDANVSTICVTGESLCATQEETVFYNAEFPTMEEEDRPIYEAFDEDDGEYLDPELVQAGIAKEIGEMRRLGRRR